MECFCYCNCNPLELYFSIPNGGLLLLEFCYRVFVATPEMELHWYHYVEISLILSSLLEIIFLIIAAQRLLVDKWPLKTLLLLQILLFWLNLLRFGIVLVVGLAQDQRHVQS
jgi:hypothetical protein